MISSIPAGGRNRLQEQAGLLGKSGICDEQPAGIPAKGRSIAGQCGED
jgi:hypothetical protein